VLLSSPRSLAFHPSGRILAWAGGHDRPTRRVHSVTARGRDLVIHLWDIYAGCEVASVEGHQDEINCIAFSPDGKSLASTSRDGSFRLWEVASQTEMRRFENGEDMADCFAFSPDGRTLVCGMRSGSVIIWNIKPRGWKQPMSPVGGKQLRRLWTELGLHDCAQALDSISTLAARPSESIPFICNELVDPKQVGPEHIRRLIADLSDARFSVRLEAETDLSSLRRQVVEPILTSLMENGSLELRQRGERILRRIGNDPDELRITRAVMVLESIGTVKAQQALEYLTIAGPDKKLRNEALESVQRLIEKRSTVLGRSGAFR
jgi:WD domain, G-beta repeat